MKGIDLILWYNGHVQGCDGPVLLDDTITLQGEKKLKKMDHAFICNLELLDNHSYNCYKNNNSIGILIYSSFKWLLKGKKKMSLTSGVLTFCLMKNNKLRVKYTVGP